MKFVAAWIQNEKCPANGDGIGNGTDALEFLRSGAEWIPPFLSRERKLCLNVPPQLSQSRALRRSRADEIHLQSMGNPKPIFSVKDSTQAE